jgi:hypothetical protein
MSLRSVLVATIALATAAFVIGTSIESLDRIEYPVRPPRAAFPADPFARVPR